MVVTPIRIRNFPCYSSRHDTNKSNADNPAAICGGQQCANGAEDRHQRKSANSSQWRLDVLTLQANQQSQQKRNAKVLEDR
jgi:hypothetical protein